MKFQRKSYLCKSHSLHHFLPRTDEGLDSHIEEALVIRFRQGILCAACISKDPQTTHSPHTL